MSLYTLLSTDLLAEFAADEIGDIYSDTGGTTQITDGGAVAAWRSTENSVVSVLATRSVENDRPTYRADYGGSGYPAVEFDGLGDGLVIPHNSAFNSTEGLTVIAIASADTAMANRFIWSRVSSGTWTTGQGIFTPTNGTIGFFTNTYHIRQQATLTVGKKIWAFSSYAIRCDNSGFEDTIASHTTNGGIGNGGTSGGNYPWDGPIFHLLICKRLAESVLDEVLYLLGQRWGVAIDAPVTAQMFSGVRGLGRRVIG